MTEIADYFTADVPSGWELVKRSARVWGTVLVWALALLLVHWWFIVTVLVITRMGEWFDDRLNQRAAMSTDGDGTIDNQRGR